MRKHGFDPRIDAVVQNFVPAQTNKAGAPVVSSNAVGGVKAAERFSGQSILPSPGSVVWRR